MRHQTCLAIAAYCAENATHQTAPPVPADEGKGRRSTTARGAPVTRTELIRRCAALDSGLVRSAGPRSCSLNRATRRNHAAPDEGNRHQFRTAAAQGEGNQNRLSAHHERVVAETPMTGRKDGPIQRTGAGTWHELRGSSALETMARIALRDGRGR